MLNTVTTSASALLLALAGGNIGPALPEADSAEPAPQDTETATVATAPESAPADEALDNGGEINAASPEVVETHDFSGSGTTAAAFQDWFNGEEFTKPDIETRDLVVLDVPGGETAKAGDTIAKFADGSFGVIK